MSYITDHPAAFRSYMNENTVFWIVGSEPKSFVKLDAPQEAELILQA